jgi:hypothetical protein
MQMRKPTFVKRTNALLYCIIGEPRAWSLCSLHEFANVME